MITKTFECEYCHRIYSKTNYPSIFKIYKHHYCSKRCAMLGAREIYRPTQGTILANNGHLFTRSPNHPNRNKNNQVPLAHLIMETYLGRYLNIDEVVHHVDLNPLNNDIANLQLMKIGEHRHLHNSLRKRDRNGRYLPCNLLVSRRGKCG